MVCSYLFMSCAKFTKKDFCTKMSENTPARTSYYRKTGITGKLTETRLLNLLFRNRVFTYLQQRVGVLQRQISKRATASHPSVEDHALVTSKIFLPDHAFVIQPNFGYSILSFRDNDFHIKNEYCCCFLEVFLRKLPFYFTS